MISSLIITFRETLEVALIVGVILSYLYKAKQATYVPIVYTGLLAGVVVSLASGILIYNIAGGFTGSSEAIFEAVMMFIAAALLVFMILWMMRQKHMAQRLQSRVIKEIDKPHVYGLFFLVFISVLREGIETAIFLNTALLVSMGDNFIGALLGMVAAALVGYLLFKGFMRTRVKYFFNITSVLLILFAVSLVVHGIHELREADVLQLIIELVK